MMRRRLPPLFLQGRAYRYLALMLTLCVLVVSLPAYQPGGSGTAAAAGPITPAEDTTGYGRSAGTMGALRPRIVAASGPTDTTHAPTALADPISVSRVQSAYTAADAVSGTLTITFTVTNNRPPANVPAAPPTSTASLSDTAALSAAANLDSTGDPNAVHDVILTDALTGTGTFTGAAPAPDRHGTSAIWNLGDIAPLASVTATLTLSVPASSPDFSAFDAGATAFGTLQGRAISANTLPAGFAPDSIDPADLASTVDADTSDPYMLIQAGQLGQDPLREFAYVQSLGYDSYLGSLRGTRGTLWSGAGNALDKASLLIAMLRASGVPARYRHGMLARAEAQALILSMFPSSTQTVGYVPPGTPTSDPANDPQLLAESADHWWVEAYLPGQGWTDLDPTYPGLSVGQTAPGLTVVTDGTDRVAAVPDALHSKVTVSLKVESYSPLDFQDNGLSYSYPLSATFDSAELTGNPLTLQHLVNQSSSGFGFAGGLFNGTTYLPYFVFDGGDIEGQPFQDTSGGLGFANSTTTAEWLEYDVQNADGTTAHYEHTITDTIGYANRQSGDITVGGGSGQPLIGPFDTFTTVFAPGEVGPTALAGQLLLLQQNQQAMVAAQATNDSAAPTTPSQQAATENLIAVSNASAAQAESLLALHFYDGYDGAASLLSTRMFAHYYADTPRIVIVSSGIGAQDGVSATLSLAMDALHNTVRAEVAPGQSTTMRFIANMYAGMLTAVAEDQIMSGTGLTSTGTSVPQVFDAAAMSGVPIDAIAVPNLNELATLPLSAQAKARIAQAVNAGKIVVVPARMVTVNGTTTVGWYEIDPQTGAAVDSLEGGWHQGSFLEWIGLNLYSLRNGLLIPLIVAGVNTLNLFVLITVELQAEAQLAATTTDVRQLALQERLYTEERSKNYDELVSAAEDEERRIRNGHNTAQELQAFSDYAKFLQIFEDPPLASFLVSSADALPTASKSSLTIAMSGSGASAPGSATLTTGFAGMSGSLTRDWQVGDRHAALFSSLAAPNATIYDANGIFLDTGATATSDNSTPALVQGDVTTDLTATGTQAFYPAATTPGLAAGNNWDNYAAQLTSSAPYTIDLNGVPVTATSSSVYTGSLTLGVTGPTDLSGAGATLAPTFAPSTVVTATNADLEFGPATVAAGSLPFDASNGFALLGYSGPLTVTAGPGGTDTVGLGASADYADLHTSPAGTTTDPFTPVTFHALIDASASDTYTTTVEAPDGWSVALDVSGAVTVTPAPGAQPGAYTILVTAQPASHPNVFVSATHTVTITPHQGMTLSLSPDPLITVPWGPADPNALPGDTNNGQLQLTGAAFRIDITNTSTTSHTFALSESGLPAGWTLLSGAAGTTATLPLPAGGVGEVGLYISPTVTMLPPAGTVEPFSIHAQATDAPALAQDATASFTVPALAFDEVTVAPPAVTSAPGYTATVQVGVRNVGNLTGTFPLSVTLPVSDWMAALASPVSLTPGQSVTQTLTLSTPDGLVGQDYPIQIDSLAEGYTQTATLDVHLSSVEGLAAATAAGQAAQLFPDNTALSAALAALGTAIDTYETACAGASVLGAPGSAACATDLRDRIVAALDQVVASAGTACPLLTATGVLAQLAAAISGETSVAALNADLALLPAALGALETELAEAATGGCPQLSFAPGIRVTLTGSPATYSLSLANTGNTTVTYALTLTASDASVTITPTTLQRTLPPGAAVTIPVTASAPVAGVYTLGATAATRTAPDLAPAQATAGLRALDAFLGLTGITANPPFVEYGSGVAPTVTVGIADIANEPISGTALVQLLDVTGTVVSSATVPLQIADGLVPGPYTLGTLDTTGLMMGTYTLMVAILDGSGHVIPRANGQTVLGIGQAVQATSAVTPSVVAPSDAVVTTTITMQLSPLAFDPTGAMARVAMSDLRLRSHGSTARPRLGEAYRRLPSPEGSQAAATGRHPSAVLGCRDTLRCGIIMVRRMRRPFTAEGSRPSAVLQGGRPQVQSHNRPQSPVRSYIRPQSASAPMRPQSQVSQVQTAVRPRAAAVTPRTGPTITNLVAVPNPVYATDAVSGFDPPNCTNGTDYCGGTTLSYSDSTTLTTTVTIQDATGAVVATPLSSTVQPAGQQSTPWNGEGTPSGTLLPNGVYTATVSGSDGSGNMAIAAITLGVVSQPVSALEPASGAVISTSTPFTVTFDPLLAGRFSVQSFYALPPGRSCSDTQYAIAPSWQDARTWTGTFDPVGLDLTAGYTYTLVAIGTPTNYDGSGVTQTCLPLGGYAVPDTTPPPPLTVTTASGYTATIFAHGFYNTCGLNCGGGPFGLAFDPSGNLLVADYPNGYLYRFGPDGGTASAATQVNTTPLDPGIIGLAFSNDGQHLYLAQQNDGNVVEISPTDGHIIRTVASTGCYATGLAVDPLSGDLFVSSPSVFGFCDHVWRISNPASPTPTIRDYVTSGYISAPGWGVDGLSFDPDGTLYAAVSRADVSAISGTNTISPGNLTPLTNVPAADGIAVAVRNDPSHPPFLVVNRNDGTITRVDLTPPYTQTDILTGGSRGDFVTVGPDGCLYAIQSSTILKITNADGTCSLVPTNHLSYIATIDHQVPLSGVVPLTDTAVPPLLSSGADATATHLRWQVRLNAAAPVTTTLFQARLPAMQPGEVREVAAGTTITYTGGSVPGVLHLGPLSVAAAHLVALTPPTQTVGLGDQMVYTLTLFNPTGAALALTPTLAGLPAGWGPPAGMLGPLTLPAGAQVSLPLTVTVPVTGTPGLSVLGDHPFAVTVATDTGGQDQAAAVLTVTNPTFTLALAPSIAFGSDGDLVPYTATLTNLDGVSHTYTLAVTGLAPHLATLPPPVLVPARQAVTLPITISVHSDLGPHPFTLLARDETGTTVSASAVLVVLGDRRVAATLAPVRASGGPGVPVLYTLALTNTGTLSDTYALSVSVPAGWSYQLQANGVPVATLALSPYVLDSATLALLVTPPAGTAAGDYPLGVSVTSQGDPSVVATAAATYTVTGRGVQVALAPAQRTLSPAQQANWQVVVTNTGTLPDTYTLVPGGIISPTAVFTPATVAVPAGESRTVQLGAGPMDFALHQSYRVGVTAVSQADPAIQNTGTATVTFTGNEAVQVALEPASQTLTDTLQAAYLMVITNTGNLDTVYRFAPGSTPGGLDLAPEISSLEIPAHMAAGILLSVGAPGPGTYTIQVQATSADREAIGTGSGTLTIQGGGPTTPTATTTVSPTGTPAPTTTGTPPATAMGTPAPSSMETPPATATTTSAPPASPMATSPAPSATATTMPLATATSTPPATATPTATATSTSVPTMTGTSAPPALTSTPTGTLPPTAGATAVPSATGTPIASTATPTIPPPTPTNTRVPPAPPVFHPRISLRPTVARPGTRVRVFGTGFTSHEQITLALNGAALLTAPGVVVTNRRGRFTATFVAPGSLLAGANTVGAIGTRSRQPALAPLLGLLPLAAEFYLAGGVSTRAEHAFLALLNPTDAPAHVRLIVYYGHGATLSRTLTVPAATQRLLPISHLGPISGPFGLHVTADRAIVAGLTLTRDGQDGDSILGNTGLSTRWYLAEGYTGLTFHETVALLNPDPRRAAHVRLALLPLTGRVGRLVRLVVPAHTQRVVDVNRLLPGRSLSIIATSDRGIVVERTLTFSTHGYGLTTRAGTNVAATSWLFAEGEAAGRFQTYLTVLNPGARPAHVTTRFYGTTGRLLGQRTITVDGLRRGNITINSVVHSGGVASVLSSNRPVVVERPEYFGSPNGRRVAGSDAFGRNGVGVSWSFPDGDTGRGSTELLLLYNPSSIAVPVEVSVYGSGGRSLSRRVLVRPGVRMTLEVARLFRGVTGLHGAMLRALDGAGFVAEQTVYATNYGTLRSTQGLAR